MPDGLPATRRNVLKAVAGGAGALALGGVGLSVAQSDGSDPAPTVEWTRTYEGPEREYEFIRRGAGLVQTDDGGYVALTTGAPVDKAGGLHDEAYFALVKTDSSGHIEWVEFVDDELDNTTQKAEALERTADGGFAIAGYNNIATATGDPSLGAQVAKTDARGNVQWLETYTEKDHEMDGDEPETQQPNNVFATVKQTADGGYVCGGLSNAIPWLVKVAADGTKQWGRYYPDYEEGQEAGISDVLQTGDGGYVFTVDKYVVGVDSSGSRQWETKLDGTFVGLNAVVASGDGGYAVTGIYDKGPRSDLNRNYQLAKLDADGTVQWRETYDGPYEGTDLAMSLVTTADGGYAIGGEMEAAYSGEQKAAVVKTDADGTEQWEALVDGVSMPAGSLVQTGDGGYAFTTHDDNEELETGPGLAPHPDWDEKPDPKLVKLSAGSADDGGDTLTATPTETPEDTPTETPDDTPTETPTETPDDNC